MRKPVFSGVLASSLILKTDNQFSYMKLDLFLSIEVENLQTGELSKVRAFSTVSQDCDGSLKVETLVHEKTGEPILIGEHERNQVCEYAKETLKNEIEADRIERAIEMDSRRYESW